jgi:uncharacterized protein (TIRG00374 family)
MARKALKFGLSIALAAALLALFLYNVDLGQVGQTLAAADLWLITASTAVCLLAYWLRTLRWQLILRSAGTTRHSSALIAIAVGYAAMALLPARAGDLVRPLAITQRDRLPLSAGLASMVTERLFDLLTVIFFFLIFTLAPPASVVTSEETSSHLRLLNLSGYAAAAGLVVATVLLLCLFRYQERFIAAVSRPVARIRPRWRQPIVNFFEHFLDGLRVLQKPRDLAIAVASSLLLWYVIYWQVQLALMAFDIHLPLRASFLLVALAVIGLAIPTPGGVGGFHKATQIGLTVFFGVELNLATGVAIAYHAVSFLPITVIGLLCLPLLGMSLREVGTASVGEQEASP